MRALLLLFSIIFIGNPQTKNDLVRQNLKGRVKKVTHCQFPMSYGIIDTPWSTTYIFKYDEHGNQVADEDYTGGSLLKGLGKLNHKHIYKYDEHGNQVEVLEYNGDYKLSQRIVYVYDDSGRRIERRNYSPEEVLWRRSVFKYNSLGQQSEVDKYDADSDLIEQFTYRYDEKGYLMAESCYVHRIKDTVTYKALQSGDREKAQNTVVRLDYFKQYTYDDSGNRVTEINNMYGAPIPFTNTYKYVGYDAEGNWLRQICIGEKGKQTNIVDRVIDYY